MIRAYLGFTVRTFKSRKLRSYLTMLGIFVGIAAIVSLISLGQGLQTTITEQFEQMGTDKIMVVPAGGFFGMGSDLTNPLTEKDEDVIVRIAGVKETASMIYKQARIKSGREVQYTWVSGFPVETEKYKIISSMANFKVIQGRDLDDSDKYSALAGIRFSQSKVFDKELGPRSKIEIEGKDFKIVGVLDTFGNPEDDSSLFIPLEAAREIYNEPDESSMIYVQTQKNYNTERVAEQIEKKLRQYRGLKVGQEDFSVQTFSELFETFNTIFIVVQIILIGIASISLVVGGIGIMNTMYTSVLERTREIGIMKAIGATNNDIKMIFLVESGLLGLAGGVVGIIIGIGMAKLVEIVATQVLGTNLLQIHFPWYLIVGALTFSFVVGAASGTFPAIKASKLKPVEALRYE